MTNFQTARSGWLAVATLTGAAALTACGGGGGGDADNTPAPAPTNLADCHNPSMYAVGSNWSVASTTTSTNNQPGGTPSESQETVDEMTVAAAPAEWGLGAGTVRHLPYQQGANDTGYDGTYVRISGGAVQTVYRVQVDTLRNRASYVVFLPALEAPISLAQGESIERTAGYCFLPEFGQWDGNKRVYPKPVNERCPESPIGVETNRWTFNGAASVTVPAGTFMTCNVSSVANGVTQQEWRVAHGTYKGLTVKQVRTYGDSVSTKEAKSIRVDWK